MFICTECQRQSGRGESAHGNAGRLICYQCEGLTEPRVTTRIPITASTTSQREYRCGHKCGTEGRRGAPPLFNKGKKEIGPWVDGYELGFRSSRVSRKRRSDDVRDTTFQKLSKDLLTKT
jgi:hypothetical protein